ncbi:lipopolysaccharide-responsive and beige-like anchor protein isoform X6 [Struthio camelus]|uniref:lipopolysaccharide-responsive and beige-like anchor protein isoform X6 n=1 Tax=Struthio camelus TaxID=8801 RepID=UPI003603C6AE
MASAEKQVVQPTGDDGGGGGGGGGAGKEGNAAEGGSVLQPLNPGIPIRGIRMKFAVLTGLVKVGEVSNRDIVETVFNLLVGGHFDLEMNFIIQEREGITCMVDLLDKCDITCQAEVWSMFTAILKKSIRNLQACTEVGLVEQVLKRIDKADNMIADLLVDMLGVLASYNLTVRELKLFFSKLQGEQGRWPPHAGKLLSVLKHMPQKYGPDAFFSFPGKSAAGIALPPIAKWPYQNGFTFHTWLRMDPVNNINVDKDKPYLYCFRTNKGLGYSAHFVGGCLIVTSIKSKGKGFQHCVKFDFKPQKWYMVTIVHIYNRWKNSELRCYVNGELASYGEITWFVNTSDTFDKCFLGSSETADANRVFCGQMTSVYLFSEALNAAQIFAIYQLGLGYKGTFKFKAESDLFLDEHHKLLLYDGKLSSAIAFMYNPRATDAQLCLESSPKDNASIFVHSPHALMLQDVKAVLTHSIQSAMHSIGGVQVLFPLFAQLDYRQYSSDHIDTTVCSTLLAFIMELLKNSIAMQEQMLSCKGFLVIGYSLEKSSKAHVTRAVLELCLALAKYLSNLHNGMPLLKQLCDHVLLNPAIWIHIPAKVQLILYTYLSTEFIGTVNIYNAIRRVGTVLLIMHTLKYYYWIVNPQDRSGITPKGLDGPRPTQKEILSLRAFLLMFIKQLVMKDYGIKEDELQAILNYLLTIHEDDNLMDVLQLLVALMSEHPSSMIPAFDKRNGLWVVYKLLASKSEGIRVQALKVMGYFLKHLAPKRKAEVMLGHGLFSLLAERLMLQTSLITMTTYNVLFEILTEQICTQVIHKQHPDPDSTVKIQNPQVLKVIAILLRNSPQCPEALEVRRAFLSDMIKLFNNSRENRRSLLQCSVWQEWMLSLCCFNPKTSEEQKITEMVYAIFRILLYHAIKYEWGGWRVWVDTLSITHSKTARQQDSSGQELVATPDGQRRDSRSTAFRIPEFKWSLMHQRLLTDLLFSVETDIQMWRSHSTKTVMDFVNSSDNVVFVHNTIHLISQVMDNMIMACGGILPLLSAATSATHELENIEPTQGLSLEASLAFLQRLINLVDVLIFASSLGFTEIESEKNMSSGGILRQCLRLVCAVAVRNCLECQQHAQMKPTGDTVKNQKAVQGLVGTGKSAAKSPVDIVTGGISPIRDHDRLLQDMDINRLRAVVFRDIEDSKQAQFLALAVVYFISVLMVSKYRDILEPQNERRPANHSHSFKASENGSNEATAPATVVENRSAALGASSSTSTEDSESTAFVRRRDSGLGEEPASGQTNSSESVAEEGPLNISAGPDAISEVLCTLSLEVNKSQEGRSEAGTDDSKPATAVPAAKNVNVKDILRSLVSTPADGTAMDPALLPPAFLGPLGDAAAEQPLQFHSFDRSVVVQQKKSTVSSSTATMGIPANAVSVVSSLDSSQALDLAGESPGRGSSNSKLPTVPAVSSVPEDSASNMSITDRLEHALEKAAPLLREIFVDFAPFLSRTLLGSHGQELLIEGTSLVCMKSSSSVVELVMLLCSQEWQNSIQKNAGLAFIELVNEGRLLSQTMKDHLVRVANEAEFILSRQRAEDIHRHAEFESLCAQYSADKREEEKMCDHLIRAAKYRDHVTATQLIQKIINILTDKHGAWGSSAPSRPREFWRLDYWEDDLRRRRRFVRNPLGSTHPEATLKAAGEHAPDEDVLVKGKQSIKSQVLGNQNSESEILLEGDDDALSSIEDKDLDNFTGPVNLSAPAQLVAPSVVVKGTLSITSSEVYFEVDEEDPSFKKIDPKILAYTEGLHGKWLFSEIRSVFSRRYLLQNTALEIFMANRVAVMFNFPDQATVKKVVNCLPPVGIGTSFGLPQTRRISLASPRQIFKASNMTQRWQHREISNFEYLMFLNTIAGRTYNDLNQYPVFPWVITNYESEELDLTLPSNFRDLSKPIGALNPKRAAFFAERYESWEDDQVPKFHYGTHYSTASFALTWLLRIEPFTTLFLNLQGGKFDHADRTFSSISRAWRNSQRDTSDIKELIPEFYYLPEIFVNSNNYNLGVMDDGTVVSDVELPPWAKTPEEFVRINRLALESEFVSCQLHQWIDLIFGYKQQGPEAVRSLNVFYYLTYEGAVNLNSITDPVLREAVEAQIRSFGQTPSQLLIEPHPPRSSAMQVYLLLQSPLMFTDQAQQDVIMVLKFPSNSPVTHVAANTQPGLATPAVITVTANRLFAVNKWHNLPAHQGAVQDQPYQLPVEIDPLIASNTGMHRRQITDLLDQSIQVHSQCFVITSDNRYILVCGFWDKSFRVYSTDSGKLIQVVFGHWDVVTCLARSESYIGGNCYILSGSRDATLLLWYWNGKTNIIGDNTNGDFATPRAILTGHDYEITCATVCAELGLVISGSKEGPCLIHSMNGDLLRTLEGPENCLRPKLIQASREGHCVIYYENGFFCVFSVNGKLQATMETGDNIKAIQLSRDGQYLLTGGDNGVVMVWQLWDLKQLFAYPGCDAGIRSMALSYDQRCIMTGMASGSIVVFYNDFNRWHHEYQTRY